jgi:ABC-type transport system involved in multi-copper enzyme maturation permease subunit
MAGVRLLRATLRKLRRRPATIVTFILLNLFTVLIFVAAAAASRSPQPTPGFDADALFTFPSAYRIALAFLFTNGLLAAAYGAAIAGSEWSWGTLKAAVARGESRTGYVLGTFAGIVIVLTIFALGGLLIGMGSAILGALIAGASLDGAGDLSWLADLPDVFGRGLLAFAMAGALGFAVATIAKSQIAGIGAVVGVNIGESVARLIVPSVFQWFPFSAANAMLGGELGGSFGGGGFLQGLDPTTAIVVTAGWLVAALAVAAVWTERAEIGG